MSQEEVLELLKERGEMTAEEIAEEIKIHISNVRRNLIRLVKFKEVKRKILTLEEAEEYGMSRKGCKHVVWKIK